MTKLSIEAEIAAATGLVRGQLPTKTSKRDLKQDTQEWLQKLLRGTSALEDHEFDALSQQARDWIDKAADRYNSDKPLPDISSTPVAEEEFEPPASTGIPIEDLPDADMGGVKKAKRTDAQKTPKAKKEKPVRKSVGSVDRDQFGVREGTSSAKALKMFVAGAKMSDVKAATGVNHYNLLNKVKAEGHTVEYGDDGTITVRSKSEAAA